MLPYKSETGKVVALQDRCRHRGVPLHLGRREGDCVRCMYHLIEAQQQVLDADPQFEMQAVVADAGLSHFRRTFAAPVAQEQAELATQQAAHPAAVVRPHQAGIGA